MVMQVMKSRRKKAEKRGEGDQRRDTGWVLNSRLQCVYYEDLNHHLKVGAVSRVTSIHAHTHPHHLLPSLCSCLLVLSSLIHNTANLFYSIKRQWYLLPLTAPPGMSHHKPLAQPPSSALISQGEQHWLCGENRAPTELKPAG
uniref:Uncharacterized protein n=1 Tax=Knipowitschia caucasica TaxID=637954 RepID=A0AAV2KCR4_KNICA